LGQERNLMVALAEMIELARPARSYLEAGLCVLPARTDRKSPAPCVGSWKPYQERRPTAAELDAWLDQSGDGLCLVCGEVSGNLEAIDFDLAGEAFERWRQRVREMAPELLERLVIERSPSGGWHVFYRCEGTVSGSQKLAERKHLAPDGTPVIIAGKQYEPRQDSDGQWHVMLTMIETRGEGGLVLCAPTLGYELTQGDLAALPVINETERSILLDVARSLNEHWPEPVSGPPPSTAASSSGLRPGDDFDLRGDVRGILQKHGWTLAKAGENEYWRRHGKTCDHSATLKDRVFYVHSTSAAPFEGKTPYRPFAVYTMLEHHGNFSAAASALRAEGYGDNTPDTAISVVEPEWPEPFPLDDPQPPPMPSGLLPGWLGRMAESIAEATETPIEMPALLCLSAVATAAQGRFSVLPEASYFEPLNIWTAPAMKSGQRKSAVQKLATKPLLDWEREKSRAVADKVQVTESRLQTVEARITRLRTRCANEDDPEKREALQEELEELERSKPELPVAPRLFTQDVTPEHLGTMLAAHNERMAVLSDEGGVFDILAGRYSNGMLNLDLFLQAHAGSPVRVDRGSRPSVLLDHPLLTIGLSPQPDVLRSLNNKPGFRGRGLLARFLYALPQSKMGYRDLVPREVPAQTAERYAAGLRALLDTPQHYDNSSDEYRPHLLFLDGAAYEAWKAHQRRIEVELRDTGRFAGITDWAGKLPGATIRLSGLMHCAHWALESGSIVDREIAEDTVSRAVQLGDLLAEHALAVFDMMSGGDLDEARKVWASILGGIQSELTFSQIWHPLRGTFKSTAAMEAALEILLDHNLILPADKTEKKRRGRTGRRFVVNPRARELGTASTPGN